MKVVEKKIAARVDDMNVNVWSKIRRVVREFVRWMRKEAGLEPPETHRRKGAPMNRHGGARTKQLE